MSGPTPAERERAEAAVEVTRRAIRRLDVLEWVTLGGAFVMAIAGGAAVAWLVVGASGLPFRPVWTVCSLILFVVPGGITIFRHRREEQDRVAASTEPSGDDHG